MHIRNKWVLSVLLALTIIITAASSYSVLNRALLTPNFQVTEVSISQPTISHTTGARNLVYSLLVQGSYTFSYPANESVSVNLGFSNNEGYMAPKAVAFTYLIDGKAKVVSFNLPPYASAHHTVDLRLGQVLQGNLCVSGSLINDVYFSFHAATVTQSINFSFKLVNSGYSDGSAVVEFRSDGVSVWSNKYYLEAGGSEVETGNVTIPDKEDHAFLLIVVEQGR